MSKQPVGGVPGFKIVVTCVFIDEHGDGTPCWTAMVDRFPDVRGYSESPVEAVTIAAEAAAELWFNEKDRPSDQPTVAPADNSGRCGNFRSGLTCGREFNHNGPHRTFVNNEFIEWPADQTTDGQGK